MAELAKSLKKQRESDVLAGNDAAVQSSRALQLQLAGQRRQGGFVRDSMLASAVEKGALKEIDTPEARARLEELVWEKNSMADTNKRLVFNVSSGFPGWLDHSPVGSPGGSRYERMVVLGSL